MLSDPMAMLATPAARDDPYPIYRVLRAQGSLVRTRLGNWIATGHGACNAVLRDRRMGHYAGGGQFLSFLEMNPPDHSRLRKVAAPAFAPRRIAEFAERIDKQVHRLLDDLPDEPFDFVARFAAPVPITVISELLGVPYTDEFAHYGAVIGSALDGVKSAGHAQELMRANAALAGIFGDLLRQRRQDPRDDVLSAVVNSSDVAPHELVALCTLLLIAGFETTVNLISNAVVTLLNHPEQWALLRADPSLAASAVEEVLRFEPPVQRTGRLALEATEVGGVPIRRGQYVVTLLGAANRDPDVYANPDEFDIRRERAVEHLAFSSGIHYCLGAPLARLEGTIALRALAERLPRLEVVGPVTLRESATIRGPLRLPVRHRRAA